VAAKDTYKYQSLVISGASTATQARSKTMTRNTSISLGDHFGAFIAQQVSQGRYGSASEVVRAGLRQLEEQEIRLAALRAALVDGESSGASTNFDVDAFLKAKRQKAAATTGHDAASV
jgi:antitoxin ParD1/3/4